MFAKLLLFKGDKIADQIDGVIEGRMEIEDSER